jgi:hypothetical protein
MPKKTADNIITISNAKILKFFEQHDKLDVEQTILSFIDIMNRLSDTMVGTIDNTLILTMIERMQTVENSVSTINNNLNKVSADIHNNFSTKMNEYRVELIEQLKLNLTSNVSTEIAPLVKQQTDHLFEKTANILREIIPSSNLLLTKNINDTINTLQSSIIKDTESLAENTINISSLNDFIAKIETNLSLSQKELETKLQNNLNNTSQILNNSQLSIEHKIEHQRTDAKSDYNALRGICETNQARDDTSHTHISEILKKLGNSSSKGIMSENLLKNILIPLYPQADIKHVGQLEKESGDIILTRENKPTIIIDNKNYENNNPSTDEVNKFVRDIKKHNCCGLFISQHTGIALKENFEINIEEGKVVLYMHKVNNDPLLIKVAINIIDAQQKFYDKLKINGDTNMNISKEILDKINDQYREFAEKKLSLLKTKEKNHKDEKKLIEELILYELDDYLQKIYQYTSNHIQCDFCLKPFKNKQALSAHQKACTEKKTKSAEPAPVIHVNMKK